MSESTRPSKNKKKRRKTNSNGKKKPKSKSKSPNLSSPKSSNQPSKKIAKSPKSSSKSKKGTSSEQTDKNADREPQAGKREVSQEVTPAKSYKDFDFYCELLVFGFCRTKHDADFAQIEVPIDIIKLCLLWFNPNTINLHCQTLTGECIPIKINPKDHVWDIKFQIYEKSGISPDEQELWQPNIGKLLKDELKVHVYDLHDNDRLRLTKRQISDTN